MSKPPMLHGKLLHGELEPNRPRRRDGYRDRVRLHARIDPETYAGLEDLADSLRVSLSHFIDLLGAIAIEDGGDWLAERVRARVKEGIHRAYERRRNGF